MKKSTSLRYKELKKIMDDIGKKKLQDLDKRDIFKFLIIEEELEWISDNYDIDDFTFDETEVDRLSDVMDKDVNTYFNEDLFMYNDIHSEIESEE